MRSARRNFADIVARDVMIALQHAHACGIVHCDVRPENIVWANDRAVLVDWGLGRRAGARLCGCGTSAFADARIFTDARIFSARSAPHSIHSIQFIHSTEPRKRACCVVR